jgi:phage baseplate assembly protein W
VVEHVDRLLRTAPGQLIDDPDWGIDLEGELSNDMGMAGVVKLTERVRQALVHDPRIPEASVKGRWDPTPPGTLRLDMTLYLGTGPFELTGTVSELGLTVERLRQ